MDLQFRKAESKDIDSMIEISRYTIDKCYREWLDDYVVDLYLESDSLNNYLTQYLSNTWLVTSNSNIIGLAICVENMIDYILVHSDHQNNGIGLKLLNYCETSLFDGYSTIAIENFELNSSPVDYFRANGWEYVNKYFDAKFNLIKSIYAKKIHPTNVIVSQ